MVTSWPLFEIPRETSCRFELRPNDPDEVDAQSTARSIGIEPRRRFPVNASGSSVRLQGSWRPIRVRGRRFTSQIAEIGPLTMPDEALSHPFENRFESVIAERRASLLGGGVAASLGLSRAQPTETAAREVVSGFGIEAIDARHGSRPMEVRQRSAIQKGMLKN